MRELRPERLQNRGMALCQQRSEACRLFQENERANIRKIMVIDRWRIVASLEEGEFFDPEEQAPAPLDLDTYKILTRFLKSGKARIVPLGTAQSEQMSWL